MRLVYLSTDPGISWGGAKGASVHLGEIVEALAREGADVLVLVNDVAPEAPSPAPRVTVEKLPFPRKHVSVDELLAGESALARWLEERIRVFGSDALQERIALYSAAGSTAAHALGVPHLVELNAPLPEEAARYRTLERPEAALELERTVLSSADLVFPVSSPLADYASRRGATRVEVMPNAVSLQRFEAPPTGTHGRAPIAVFAGALRPWHGVDTIAEAWQRLGSDAPRLRVIGDGPGRDALAAVGGEMMGAVAHAEVPALLVSADIGLAPYSADAPTYFSRSSCSSTSLQALPSSLRTFRAYGISSARTERCSCRPAIRRRSPAEWPRSRPTGHALAPPGERSVDRPAPHLGAAGAAHPALGARALTEKAAPA
jgi:glycosyltransferase involved in cell wall biosynthesis